MLDIEGVSVAASEEKKVKDALAALAKDPHAPRELSIRVTLHVYNEYPKHVTVGQNEDGSPITKVVASTEEEATLYAAPEPAAPQPEVEPAA